MRSTTEGAIDSVVAAADGPAEEILALVELADRVEAALVERVAVFDAAEGWAADGAYSFACWLRSRADVTRAESLQLTRFTRALRTMPATESALATGTLSVAKARLLAGVLNERTAEQFAKQEEFLIEQVQALPVDHVKIVLDHWKQLADRDGPDPDDPTRNWARLTPGFNGRWHLEGDLDPVAGTLLKAVLDAISTRMHQQGRFADLTPDADTAAHRDASALLEIAALAANPDASRPAVHPDVVIVVPVEALTTGAVNPFNPPTVRGGGPVSLNSVLRFAMLGSVSVMTTDSVGRPLHLGRKQRLASSDQWTALTVRDNGCVTPGCDRPAAHCQAHHLAWWDRDHGTTDLQNLALVCSHHHHLIHDQGWTLHPDDASGWQLTRPDNTPVPPPRYQQRRCVAAQARAPA